MSLETLHAIGIQDSLSSTADALLSEIACLVQHDSGVTLFREGENHLSLYWIKTGRIRLEMSRKHSGSTAVLTVGEGDLLAWSALLGDGRMTATAVTMSPTSLLAFDAFKLRDVCDQNHDIGYLVMRNIARLISKRLVATRLQLLDLFDDGTPNVGGFRS